MIKLAYEVAQAIWSDFGLFSIPGTVERSNGHKNIRFLGRWSQYLGREPDDADFEGAWFQAESSAGLAVITGRTSGIFVSDCDSEKAEELFAVRGTPRTPTFGSPRGPHRVYRYPQDMDVPTSASAIVDGLDIVSDGHVQFFPPTPSYTWEPGLSLDDLPIAEAPNWLIEEIRLASRSREGGTAAARDRIVEGARNRTLTSIAGSMRKRGATREAIEAALLTENDLRCQPPLPEAEVRSIAASVARYVPEHAAEGLTGADTEFELTPLDWEGMKRNGLPKVEYLVSPILPKGARVWAWGPAESGKSMFALWVGASLTRQGHNVAYISQENPIEEDVRRLDRLPIDWNHFRFFHDQGVDLANPKHVEALIPVAGWADLVVLDTLTGCWSGNEADNAAIVELDRVAIKPLIREKATVLIIHHTGHIQDHRRRGVSAGRGASSMGQKGDAVLEFQLHPQGFEVWHSKGRMGGQKSPPRLLAVTDTDDGGLTIRAIEELPGVRVQRLAEKMVDAINKAGFLTTSALRKAVRSGKTQQEAAMQLLIGEDHSRVRVDEEVVETKGGQQKAQVWRPLDDPDSDHEDEEQQAGQ